MSLASFKRNVVSESSSGSGSDSEETSEESESEEEEGGGEGKSEDEEEEESSGSDESSQEEDSSSEEDSESESEEEKTVKPQKVETNVQFMENLEFRRGNILSQCLKFFCVNYFAKNIIYWLLPCHRVIIQLPFIFSNNMVFAFVALCKEGRQVHEERDVRSLTRSG